MGKFQESSDSDTPSSEPFRFCFKKTPWPESASELYRPSDRRRSDCQLSADRECQAVSVTDPYGRILGFLDRSRYFSIKQLLSCTHEAEWTPFQTHYFFFSGNAGNIKLPMIHIAVPAMLNCYTGNVT
jgi:hypothetical protein